MKSIEEWASTIADQSGKIILITGANTGLGFEDARFLAGKGTHIIMACRDLDKANSAKKTILDEHPGGVLDVLQLNLADFASIDEFSARVLDTYSQLDVLINNAAAIMTPYQKTTQSFELGFGVNHLGHFRLTALLLPLLLKTSNARVVNVSSSAHKFGKIDFENLNSEKKYKPMKAYGQSKLANLLFTYELQRRVSTAGKQLLVVASHPGWAKTHPPRSRLQGWMSKLMIQSAAMGALSTILAAVGNNIEGGKYYGPGGFMEVRGFPKEVQSSKMARDIDLATKLWTASEKLTGISYDSILST
ncbi:MAG TPA: oxidoreductase [Candidatus Lokiarchaeia archaeon]|nr:oxidoreductase [Candidatus Lokiarchaeia archaeon]